jgi:signal transduction histidine kinase
MESANRFLRQIIFIGAILVIIGIFIAWLMSRTITKPLKKLTTAATTIASGNYSAQVAVDRPDEVGELARAFNAMIEQVSKAKDGLEQKIVESAEMNEQLRDLSAYLQNVREDERIHIAREMHDELGQVLTGFKMDVSWLRKKLANSNDPVMIEKIDSMLAVVDDSIKFVRKLASELRPSILDDLGLVPALEWHSQEFEKRYNIKTEFNSAIPDLNIPSVVATGLFRMYQESLTNVARHSNATRVVVKLTINNDELSLSISDDGKGFDISQANKKTLGLLGMKERAAMIGGKLEIISEPGKGTTIIITVKHIVKEQATVS